MFRRHPLLGVLTLAYLAVVGWVTLGPQPIDERRDGWLFRLLELAHRHGATSWITYDRLEFTANVAMFLPIGTFFLMLLGRRRWWVAILAGVTLTCAIEFTQLFLPTRVSDVRDIVANSLGAALGVVAGLIVTAPKARRLRLARAEAGS